MTQNDPSESESEWEATFGVARGGILGPVVTTTRAETEKLSVHSVFFPKKEASGCEQGGASGTESVRVGVSLASWTAMRSRRSSSSRLDGRRRRSKCSLTAWGTTLVINLIVVVVVVVVVVVE